MSVFLLITAIIIFSCIFMNRITDRIGIPALLAFIGLGMFFGNGTKIGNGMVTFGTAENICSIALIFIMFYGGFGTNWKEAKKVAPKAILLSTLGVLLTATVTALFCHFILKMGMIESFLLGSILASTDAASVFAILRSRKLNLKYNTASLLEIESGSNDPVAYMMTAIFIAIYKGTSSGGAIGYMIFAQIAYGLAFGFGIAFLGVWLANRLKTLDSGFFMIFIVGIAILGYAAPSAVGGNGYLSVYIVGLILGNKKFKDKTSLVHFFDGVTTFMQILIFFILGVLSKSSMFPAVLLPAILIAIFMTFIARPAVVFGIMAPFKSKINQMLLVSWSGLRGASSIVFAISVIISVTTNNDIFHIAFIIVLFSIFIQGSLLPKVAKSLNMIDDNEDIMKTFNDYVEEVPIQFIKFCIPKGHEWIGKSLKDITMPPDTLIVMIKRGDTSVLPKGETILLDGDKIILSARSLDKAVEGIELAEIQVDAGDDYDGKMLSEIPNDEGGLVVMIKRGENVIIPRGNIILQSGDIMVINYNSTEE